MDLFQITLIIATFLCSLVGGFLLAFTIVIMPGIKTLNDRDFIQTFQVIDRVLQNGQPIFISLWIGSIIFLLISAIAGIGELNQTELIFMVSAVFFYLFGVQLPTATINVPLNNRLQNFDIKISNETEQQAARETFESRWARWNLIRSIFSILTSLLLILLLFLI